jgi:hypothetical protein
VLQAVIVVVVVVVVVVMSENYTAPCLKVDVVWVVTLRRLVIEHCIISWKILMFCNTSAII